MKLKAYICRDRIEKYGSTVVFAESPGKARMLAQKTDTCEDLDFIDIEVRRAPALDDAYRGRFELDWYNDQDRIRMVRDAHFRCSSEDGILEEWCRACAAFPWCGMAEDWRDKEAQQA